MLIDTQNLFDWEHAITDDRISTNVIDLLPNAGALGAGGMGGPDANLIRDIGSGQPLYLHALVTTLFETGDAGTLTATLESDSTANLATSATVHMTFATAVAAATMIPGYWLAKGLAIPAGPYERYLGIRWTTNTGDFTGGKVSAWISNNRYDDRVYAGGWKTGVN